ncbi:MAG: polysaccharide deacetylase family protein [Actinomycetota bacterium]|nr:polysaccharide deacetylase family protein [Actinomycetota bacterium]
MPDSFPKPVVAALGAVAIFELLYATVFDKWLGQWFVFRAHLPGMFALGVILISAAVSYYEYHGIGPQGGIVRRGRNHPHVALTFDDGPSPEYTPKILDVLKEKEAKAAFFMVGKHVEKYPDVARRVFAEGHDIGNHTYSHRDLVPAGRKTILAELNKTEQIILRVVGVRTRLFRPPRGIISNAGRKLLVELGYTIAMWTVSAVDWRGRSPKAIVGRIMRHIKTGGVILFHDSGAVVRREGADRGNTVEALPLVIDELRRHGYEIVPLSQMIRELEQIEAESLIETQAAPSSAGQEI